MELFARTCDKFKKTWKNLKKINGLELLERTWDKWDNLKKFNSLEILEIWDNLKKLKLHGDTWKHKKKFNSTWENRGQPKLIFQLVFLTFLIQLFLPIVQSGKELRGWFSFPPEQMTTHLQNFNIFQMEASGKVENQQHENSHFSTYHRNQFWFRKNKLFKSWTF